MKTVINDIIHVQCAFFFRTEFILDENGDVSWEVPDAAEALPFFNCETYEVTEILFSIFVHSSMLTMANSTA